MLRDDLKPTGRKGIFYKEYPTKKHDIRKDRPLVMHYTIGGTTRTESLGWTSETMTVRYSHVGADAQKEAINRLSESFGATRTNNGKVLSLRTKRE